MFFTASNKVELPLLLFLLILKQLHFDELLEQLKASDSYKEVIDFLNSEQFDQSVKYPSMETRDSGYSHYSVMAPLPELISVYFLNKGKKVENISWLENKNLTIAQVATSLQQSLIGMKAGNVIDYDIYFEMIQHAGRFSD